MHAIVARSSPSGVERWPVDDAASWHRRRQQDVTASVAGALLGCHEYMSFFDLYMVKSGGITHSVEDSPPMRRGRLLEDDALQVVSEDHPDWRVSPAAFYYRSAADRLGCTPDAFAIDPLRPGFGILQVKSVEPSIFRSKWKVDDGVVEPPLWIVVQAVIEASLTGASWAGVVPFVVSHGVEAEVVEIPLHPGLMARLRREAAAFWARVEAGDVPEPDYRTDGATIAGLYPDDDGTEIDLSSAVDLPALLDELDDIRARIKADQARAEEIKARFRYAIGAAESAIIAGGRLVTLRQVRVAAHWVEESVFRALRFGRAR